MERISGLNEFNGWSDEPVKALDTVPAAADMHAGGSGKQAPVSIRSGGTYIVTGGVGIVGLQLSLALASKANVNIVLLNRSAFPARHEWKHIRYSYEMNRENELLYKRVVLLEQITAAGSNVVCMQADIADEASLGEALDSIRGQCGADSWHRTCCGSCARLRSGAEGADI